MQQGDAGMSDQEWRPKVGERVAANGIVVSFVGDAVPYLVEFDGPSPARRWCVVDELSPLPAPRQPWDVLREAASILYESQQYTTHDLLVVHADLLEAAAAPKPPTLRDTVHATLSTHLPATLGQAVVNMLADRVAEALAREEAGA